MAPKRVAVVGAGLAGLTLARELARAGDVQVRVFEKARGAGGRMSTRRSDELAFDHGAQYFTCRDARFARQVQDWLERAVVAPWHARVVAIDHGVRKADPGADVRYVGTPRMSAVARDLARGLDVAWSQRVAALRFDDSAGRPRWWLRLEAGESENENEQGPFDAVALATPAPQAAPLLGDSVPWASAVAHVEMQPCHAAMLAFEAPIDADFDAAFVTGGPLSWVARNHSKPARGAASTWVLQTSVAWSEAHLDTPPEASAPELLDALRELLGRPLPSVTHAAVHRWLYARSEKPLGEPCLWDGERAVGVCGDWCVGGRVEGAYLSGLQLSEAMRGALLDRRA